MTSEEPRRATPVPNWAGAPAPERTVLTGRYVRLEPLNAQTHGAALYAASSAPGAEDRFRYMPEQPPTDAADFDGWLQQAQESPDPLYFAVVDQKTQQAEGRQALMRIDPANGVIEIGAIVWGPRLARTRGATEALFLFADHVFGLGYRRFEWKCNDLNEPSKRAAARFGFRPEGVFRQHLVVKGLNRDTAWFSILDAEWPALREEYVRWLSPENFADDGTQLSRLDTQRAVTA